MTNRDFTIIAAQWPGKLDMTSSIRRRFFLNNHTYGDQNTKACEALYPIESTHAVKGGGNRGRTKEFLWRVLPGEKACRFLHSSPTNVG
jgi:hypothetical protein